MIVRAVTFFKSLVAAALQYLLRARFDNAFSKGTFTVVDTSTGIVEIVGHPAGSFKFTGAGGANWAVTGAYSQDITASAGKTLILSAHPSVVGAMDTAFGWKDTTTSIDTAAWAPCFSYAGGFEYSRMGTAGPLFLSGAADAGVWSDYAIVLGGYDSSGAPSPTGTYGYTAFRKRSGSWQVHSTDPTGNAASRKVFVSHYAVPANGVQHIDNVVVPTAPNTSVFTPTGYALDKFTDVNGTLLTAHTMDNGAGWTLGEGSSPQIDTNRAYATGVNHSAIVDTGLADFFLRYDYKNAGPSGSLGPVFRYVDNNNFWWVYDSNSGGELYEKTSGSTLLRASVSHASLSGTQYPFSVRCSGNTIECWNKTFRMTYSSAVRNTATKHGFRSTNVSGTTNWVDNFYVLPLTSATYSTAFDTSGLTKDDCDLFHTFNEYPDQTLTNGQTLPAAVTLANTDVLSEGKGTLTVVDSAGGTAAVSSSVLKLTGTTTLAQTGVTGPGVTTAAGKILKGRCYISAFIGGYAQIIAPHFKDADGPADPVNGFSLRLAGSGVGTESYFQPLAWSASSAVGNYIVSAEVPSAATFYDTALVLGGFDSSGAPSATGTYGAHFFWNNGSAWRLLIADPRINFATAYPGVRSYNSSTAFNQVDDIIIPTAPDTSVFTPTGYALDTFTDTNGTLLTAHTLNSGGSWTAESEWWTGTLQVQNNQAQTGGSSGKGNTKDFGSADVFLTSQHLIAFTNASNRSQHYNLFRYTNGDNHWEQILLTSSNLHRLLERTGGVGTVRADVAKTFSDNTLYTASVRLSGNTIECWVDGGVKASYTSAVRNTVTTHGLAISPVGSPATTPYIDNFYVLPLQSSTYNTAFDTSALTKDDCDLFHTFDSIPDVTFSNGNVIRDGYVDDGSLTVQFNTTAPGGSASITGNKLSFNKATGAGTDTRVGAYGPKQTAKVVGKPFQFTLNNAVGNKVGMVQSYENTITGSWNGSARASQFYPAETGNFQTTTQNPIGTTKGVFDTCPWSAGVDYTLTTVQGGFNASGEPDATTGFHGYFYFVKGGAYTTHTLVAVNPAGDHPNLYPVIQHFQSSTGGTNATVDDIKIPDDLTVKGVFQPVGYMLDTFDGAAETALTGRALNSEQTWEATDTGWGPGLKLDGTGAATHISGDFSGNQVDVASPASFAGFYQWTARTNTAAQNQASDLFIRVIDSGNYWHVRKQEFGRGSAGTWVIIERVSAVSTTRATLSVNTSASTDYTFSARDSGSTIEAWINGGSKISYASALHFAGALHGPTFGMTRGGSSNLLKHVYVLPLTSSTYTTELDSF